MAHMRTSIYTYIYLLWSCTWTGPQRNANTSFYQFQYSSFGSPSHSNFLIYNSIQCKNFDTKKIKHWKKEERKGSDSHLLIRLEGNPQEAQRLFCRWKLRRPHLTQSVWVLFPLFPKLPVPFPCFQYYPQFNCNSLYNYLLCLYLRVRDGYYHFVRRMQKPLNSFWLFQVCSGTSWRYELHAKVFL